MSGEDFKDIFDGVKNIILSQLILLTDKFRRTKPKPKNHGGKR